MKSVKDYLKKGSSTTAPSLSKIEINNDFLSKQHVCVATPCYGGLLTNQYFLSMVNTIRDMISMNLKYNILTLGNESLIPRGRNMLVSMFLASECTHLFFIDADIEWNAEDFLRIISADKDIVVGAYPKKTLPVQYAINYKFTDPVQKLVKHENGLVEVLDASTGFMCIKRAVFDKLIYSYPELRYRNDTNLDSRFEEHCYAFFDTGIDEEDLRYLSEDYYFCRLWQKLGGTIWLDMHTKLNHIGNYTFEGDIKYVLGK